MFSHLIVPLDGSPESNLALTQACALAHLTGANITLLRVYSSIGPTPETMEFLHKAASECGDLPDGKIDVAALGGNPADVILQEIKNRGADLVVMRTRGRSGLGRAVLGSVAESIVSRSPTPVLLLPPEARAATVLRTILVPVDGSPGGSLALGAARELALLTHAKLRLLQVFVPAPGYLGHAFAGHGPIYIDPRWDEDALSAAETYVGSVTKRLSSEGLSCEGQVIQAKVLIENPVPEAIVRDATEREIDLIVMSSEAHTGVARALLGSVTDGVVRAARCPVLVLRRTAEQPSQDEFSSDR